MALLYERRRIIMDVCCKVHKSVVVGTKEQSSSSLVAIRISSEAARVINENGREDREEQI
jgi:hypothetical protein